MPTRFPIFIIDASSCFSQIYYHSSIKTTNKNIKNFPVYSFCKMLRTLATKFNFAHIVIVWDGRKEAKPTTKYEAQKKLMMDFIDSIRMEQILQADVTAYDIIFSMVKSFNHQHHDVIIVTHDKSLFSLVNEATTIFNPSAKIKNQAFINQQFLEKKYKFPLEKFPFFLALTGDTTGHIPGVVGIGEKHAAQCVQKFKTLDDLYKHIHTLTNSKIRTILKEGKQNAYESFELATPHRHPNPTTVARTTFPEKNWLLAIPFFEKYQYKKLLKELQNKPDKHISTFEELTKQCQTNFKLIIITNKEDLQKLAADIKKNGICAVNVQGSTNDPMQSQCLSICLAPDEKTVYYIPFKKHHNASLTSKDIQTTLNSLFLDENIEKTFRQTQYHLALLKQMNIVCSKPLFDITLAASFVIPNFKDNDLKKIHAFYNHQANSAYQQIFQNSHVQDYLHIDQRTWSSIADTHQTIVLKKLFEHKLDKNDLAYFQNIEMPINSILADMQIRGIHCNTTILKKLDAQLSHEIEKTVKTINSYCKIPINLNSTPQIRAFIFETLQLSTQKKLTKNRSFSTDVHTLQDLATLHPVPKLILTYRKLHKFQRTYIANLLQTINPHTHKIHPLWHQAFGATGRISASHPSIQTIPINDLTHGISIRSAFYAPEHEIFLNAGYQDIELRILAHLSQDQTLQTLLENNIDIHLQTAAKLFNSPEQKVTTHQRSIAKKINLSISYGITSYGLAKNQNIPYRQASFAIKAFFSQFPNIKKWLEATIEQTKNNGYASTLLGRKHYMPNIRAKNRVLYDANVRTTINTIIQGSASEIIKQAMINLNQQLTTQQLNSSILLQIHDQLLISCTKADLEKTKKTTELTLHNVVDWNDVQMKVNIATGPTWHDVTLE